MSTRTFPDRMSPGEVAADLGVTEGTLAVWRSTKRYPLPYVKIGRKVYYRGADVKAFVEGRMRCAEVQR